MIVLLQKTDRSDLITARIEKDATHQVRLQLQRMGDEWEMASGVIELLARCRTAIWQIAARACREGNPGIVSRRKISGSDTAPLTIQREGKQLNV